MKSILILSHAMELGGAEKSLLGLLNAIDSKMCRLIPLLVAHRPNQYKRYEKNNSISIVDGWSHGNGGRKQDN